MISPETLIILRAIEGDSKMFKNMVILSNETMYIKNGKYKLYQCDFKDFYPKKLAEDFEDIFEEPNLLKSVLRKMIRSNKYSPLRGKLIKPKLTVILIDEYRLKLRKLMLGELLNVAGFKKVEFAEMAAIVASVMIKDGWRYPVIVSHCIGSQTQLDFTFGGIILKSQYFKNDKENDMEKIKKSMVEKFTEASIAMLDKPFEVKWLKGLKLEGQRDHLMALWADRTKSDVHYIYCSQEGTRVTPYEDQEWTIITYEEMYEGMLAIETSK